MITEVFQTISTAVIALSAVVTFGITVALCGITFWYANTTKRMQEVMTRDLESRIGAIVDMSIRSAQRIKDGFLVEIRFVNGGLAPFFLSGYTLKLWPEGFDVVPKGQWPYEVLHKVNVTIDAGKRHSIELRLADSDMEIVDVNQPEIYETLFTYCVMHLISPNTVDIISKGTLPTRVFPS